MPAHKTILKKGLLVVTLLALWMPMVQSKFDLIHLYKLAGDDGTVKDTSLTTDNYLSGIYQAKMNQHLASDYGFRSLLIKINNQINFNLFHKVNAKGVITGKDEYLFETTYINSHLGKDFMGEDSIRQNLDRLKKISDQFKKLNKQLIVVIAPSKPSFYHEYLPEETVRGTTNYTIISAEMKKHGLHCLDFSNWFNEMKPISKYPLYPKHGNHWSTYGAYLAADSLLRYIESLTKADLPDMVLKDIKIEQPRNEDKDIEYGINLLFKLKSFDLAYPEIEFHATDNKKPKLLVIGDSFYWNLYHLGFANCFDTSSFWYYNKAVYSEDSHTPVIMDEFNKSKELMKQDVILILATESNIKSFGWGFLEDAENALN